jgi:hypothetical protein
VLFVRKAEKYGGARLTTDENITRRMRFAWWINKIRDTLSEYVILLAFHGNNGYANAPEYYVYTYIAHLVTFVFLNRI